MVRILLYKLRIPWYPLPGSPSEESVGGGTPAPVRNRRASHRGGTGWAARTVHPSRAIAARGPGTAGRGVLAPRRERGPSPPRFGCPRLLGRTPRPPGGGRGEASGGCARRRTLSRRTTTIGSPSGTGSEVKCDGSLGFGTAGGIACQVLSQRNAGNARTPESSQTALEALSWQAPAGLVVWPPDAGLGLPRPHPSGHLSAMDSAIREWLGEASGNER